MTCTSSSGYFHWAEQFPISFSEWKNILTRLTSAETTTNRLSSSTDRHRSPTRAISRHYQQSSTQKQSRNLPKNQIFGNGSVVDSFVASSSSIIPASFSSSRQDPTKIASPPNKRYVSSFKTLVNATNSKHPQRLNYINDSVIILKLSKEKESRLDALDGHTDSTSKISSLSMVSNGTTLVQTNTPNQQQQQQSSPPTLTPILRIEGQKRRTPHNDRPHIVPNLVDMAVASSSTNSMTTGATSHPPSNPSLFAYRSGATGGGTLRQRPIAETTSNSLLITAERLKSNMNASMRPARQPTTTTTTTTTMSSSFFSSQQQRNVNQTSRARMHQDKIANTRELYEYPDPFTNCPQDVMSKLAQLTKLQLETIEWEKKRRFTKKKTVINGANQGKDSP